MVTFACVLRTGGDFTPEWVFKLRAGIVKYCRAEAGFLCLTDDRQLCYSWARPLQYAWPGWWSKFELFRPGLFPPRGLVIYMDLDSLPVDDLSDLARYPGELALLSSFFYPLQAQSGVMLFRPGEQTARVWQHWSRGCRRLMETHRGDGELLHSLAVSGEIQPERVQDYVPGQVVSLKAHAKEYKPEGARLVCGHGQPRFSDPAAGWAHTEWKRR